MKLPSYVKPYPKWMSQIPLFKNFAGNSLYPFIFLRNDVYIDLSTVESKKYFIATIHHEELHRKRQKEQGWLIFGLKYIVSPAFRFHEELLAYQESMKWYRKYHETFPIERIARFLSGPLYFWSVSYEKAKDQLEKAWKEI